MNSNNKRKWWWAAGAALVVLYFAPSAIQWFRVARAYQQRAEVMNARAQAARAAGGSGNPAGSPAPASAPAPGAPPVSPSRLVGVWVGQQGETNMELCRVQLEISDKGQAQVNGYVKMICYPTGAYYQAHPKINIQETFMKAMTPMAAILSGTIKDGAIAFHVDKTIGTGLDGCALTSFTVTPFGTDEVAAEWQKTNCPGGQMTLSRSSK
jgi:hypothetical protein